MDVRTPVLEDAGAVTRCINALSMSDSGFVDYREGELAEEWADADLSDTLVVEDLGAIVGFLRFEDDPPYFEAYVHPGSRFPVVFDLLIDRVEAWARDRVRDFGAPLTIETDVANEISRTILERRGFLHTGTSTHFVYDVTGKIPPLDPVVRVRSYVEGDDDALFHEVLASGFGDDWDEPPSAEFIAAGRKTFGYSRDLWLLAETGGRVLGALQGFEQWVGSSDVGWVKKLAVLPEGRNRGIARALLHTSFHLFKERGRAKVFLGVENENPTGARSFYERIGMTQNGTQTTHR
ncbi:MAG: GNAT family N-acetyltransferase, partial [Actinobacteria bacterium]|nr:GNAT family N-acetyltransferase [Actinomycetota bacterium]